MVSKADKQHSQTAPPQAECAARSSGTAGTTAPRMFSAPTCNIYAQIIDDVKGVTLCAASTLDKEFTGNGGNKEAAHARSAS